MQVFNAFFRIVKKNIPALCIYVVIFLGLSLMFSGNGQATDEAMFKEASLNVAVINRDQSELGNAVKDYVGDVHKLIEIEDNKESIQDEIFFRMVEYVLIIPEGFQEDFLSGKDAHIENVKIPGSATGYFVDSQVEKYLKILDVYLASGYTMEEGITHVREDLNQQAQVSFGVDGDKDVRPAISYYFRFLPYIFTAMLIAGLGPILLVFNKKEIRQRNMCSALPLRSQNNQIVLGVSVFSFGCWLFFMVWSMIYYRNEFFTPNVAIAMLNSLVSLLVAISIAFITGAIAKSSVALSIASNAVSLGMSFLGGIFVPQEIMGENILVAARFIPTYWYTKVNDALYSLTIFDWEHMKDIYIALGIQLGFALAIFAIGLLVRKNRQLAD